jgi:hypothetical protein
MVWQVLEDATMDFFQVRSIEFALNRGIIKLTNSSKTKRAFLLLHVSMQNSGLDYFDVLLPRQFTINKSAVDLLDLG